MKGILMKKLMILLALMNIGFNAHSMDCIKRLFRRNRAKVGVADRRGAVAQLSTSSEEYLGDMTATKEEVKADQDGVTVVKSRSPLYPSEGTLEFVRAHHAARTTDVMGYAGYGTHVRKPLNNLLLKSDHDPEEMSLALPEWQNVLSACSMMCRTHSYVQKSVGYAMEETRAAHLYYLTLVGYGQMQRNEKITDLDKERAAAMVQRMKDLNAHLGIAGKRAVAQANSFIFDALDDADRSDARSTEAVASLTTIIEE